MGENSHVISGDGVFFTVVLLLRSKQTLFPPYPLPIFKQTISSGSRCGCQHPRGGGGGGGCMPPVLFDQAVC